MITNIQKAREWPSLSLSGESEAVSVGTEDVTEERDPAPTGRNLSQQPTTQNRSRNMARTLADMTPEERQTSVGMWCDNLASTAKEPAHVVLACVQGDLCWILHTDLHGERSCFSLDSVSPRFDLPRAWNPDGTPVEMEAQVSEVAYGKAYKGSSHDRVTIPEDTEVRRFVGEWEAPDE